MGSSGGAPHTHGPETHLSLVWVNRDREYQQERTQQMWKGDPEKISICRRGNVVSAQRWEPGACHQERSRKAIPSQPRSLAGSSQGHQRPGARLETVCEPEAKPRGV